jgi:peptidoglycan/LPS O-acetylase OafA/YrhL
MIFALGFVLFFLSFSKKSITTKEVFVPLMAFCLLVIFTVITKLAMFGEHLVFAVACTGIIYLLGKKGMPGVVNKTTLFLGKVSYSLYLSQYAAIKLLQKTNCFSFLHAKMDCLR